MSKWKGTPVPNTGLVEKVYFNTALSNDEVISLLQNIEYTDHPLFKFTPIISFNADDNMGDGVCGIGAIYDENSDAYMLLQMLEVKPGGESNITVTTVYSSKENVNIMNVITSTTAGWQEEVISNPVVTLNKEVVNAYNPSMQNVPSGTQNDKLSSLISTTPFELEEDEPVEEDPIDDILKPFLKEVADAIRYVEGSSEDINAQDFNERIIALGNGSGGIPEEITTAEEMTALLVERNVGKVYKFTGVTDENFTNGCYYLVEEVAE